MIKPPVEAEMKKRLKCQRKPIVTIRLDLVGGEGVISPDSFVVVSYSEKQNIQKITIAKALVSQRFSLLY